MSPTRAALSALIAYVVWMSFASGLSCSDVKKSGSGSKFTLEELRTLSNDTFSSCLVFLGKDPLGYHEGKYLWTRLTEIYENNVWNIPETNLRELGWIMKAISPRDIQNLTLAEIDTISAFGRYHNLSQEQLQALAERVREDWNAKDPTDYTFYDLMALNHILCGFNATDIAVIHPDSYKEATSVLSTLQDCPKEPLEALASLATSPTAFQEPFTWHSSQVRSVGCVLNGMSREEIVSIPPEGFESLTPDVIPCLSKETLQSMTIYQLKHFTPSAAAAISEIQKSFLDINQQRSVNEAFAGEIIKRKSNSSTAKRAFTMCQLLWSAYVFSGTRKIFV